MMHRISKKLPCQSLLCNCHGFLLKLVKSIKISAIIALLQLSVFKHSGASKPSNKSSLYDGLPTQSVPKATQQTNLTTLYGNIRAKSSTTQSTIQNTSLYDDLPLQSLTKEPASQDMFKSEKRKHDGASDANCIQKKLKSGNGYKSIGNQGKSLWFKIAV